MTVYDSKLSEDDQSKLRTFLTDRFNDAEREAKKKRHIRPLGEETQSPLSDGVVEKLLVLRETAPVNDIPPIRPQIAALLLSNGNIVGGVAMFPVSEKNPAGQDPIQEAMKAEEALKSLPHIKDDFYIVAIALTTSLNKKGGIDEVDLDLHYMSIINMGNRTTNILLLVHPETGASKHSNALDSYEHVRKVPETLDLTQ